MSKLCLSPDVFFFTRMGQIGFDLEGISGVRGLGGANFIRFQKEECKVKPVDMVKIQIHTAHPYDPTCSWVSQLRRRQKTSGVRSRSVSPERGKEMSSLSSA